MKKILAVVLALVLTLGLTTVAFAATMENIRVFTDPYTYDSKSKTMSPAGGDDYTPGNTFYFLVKNEMTGGKNITSTSALKYYNLRFTADEGKKFIESVTFTTKKDGGETNAYIAVKTVASYSSSDMDFSMDITLFSKVYNGNKVKANDTEDFSFNFSGTLTNNTTQATAYTTVTDKAPIVNFDDIDDTDPIELYFGNNDDVQFNVNAKGQGELYLKYTDDATGTKYEIDDKYPSASLDYHIFEGSKKTFRRTGKLYIKAASIGNNKAPYLYQISTAGALTQVNAKYDSNEEQFVIDTATLNNYVVSDIALKATGSTTTPSTPTETPSEPQNPSSTASSNASEVAQTVSQRIKTAKGNGTANPSVDLTTQNEESISAKDLQTIVTAAKNAGGSVRILADTTANGSMIGRLYVKPATASSVTRDIKYGIYTDDSNVSSTRNMFQKYYDNSVAVVRLAQNTSYGFPVSIAVKVDLSGLNTKTLKFYSYDRTTGKYFAIPSPAYWTDNAGYLHFNTTLAGDIVITDKPLKAK